VARVATGKWLVIFNLLGLFIGVVLFNFLVPHLVKMGLYSSPENLTLHQIFNINYGVLALIFGLVFLGGMFLVDRLDPGKKYDRHKDMEKSIWKKEWGWLTTGIVAGLIILAASAQKQYLAIMGGVLSMSEYFFNIFGLSLSNAAHIYGVSIWDALMFCGMFFGAGISAFISNTYQPLLIAPLWQQAFQKGVIFHSLMNFMSGIFLSLGALIGGGCMSGAFVAGFPTLSVGSFAMGMTFFAVAMITATVLFWGKGKLFVKMKESVLNLAED